MMIRDIQQTQIGRYGMTAVTRPDEASSGSNKEKTSAELVVHALLRVLVHRAALKKPLAL